MIGLLTIVAIGFLLGMRHATDPDHVVAVSTIVSREHSVKRSAMIGAVWGLGHTITIVVVGGAIILFRITLPPRLGLSMELAVAVMLIILGLKNLGGLFPWAARPVSVGQAGISEEGSHYHAHGDFVHAHGHTHSHNTERNPVASLDRWFKRNGLYRMVRPLIIGVIHGLAGSAAVALLVLSTISDVDWALVYLAVFGIGTILGMMLITLTIGSTFAYGQKRFVRIGQHFATAAGVISLIFGMFIAYEIGIVNGLFTGNAHWIPR
jgi:high-affinity nickel-transport protein